MGDRRRKYRSRALGGPCAKEAPTELRIENEPGQDRRREPPQETRKQVVAWHGRARDEVERRVGKRKTTT